MYESLRIIGPYDNVFRKYEGYDGDLNILLILVIISVNIYNLFCKNDTIRIK